MSPIAMVRAMPRPRLLAFARRAKARGFRTVRSGYTRRPSEVPDGLWIDRPRIRVGHDAPEGAGSHHRSLRLSFPAYPAEVHHVEGITRRIEADVDRALEAPAARARGRTRVVGTV